MKEVPNKPPRDALNQSQLKLIIASLKKSLEAMRPLLDEDLPKDIEPTSYLFHLNKRAAGD